MKVINVMDEQLYLSRKLNGKMQCKFNRMIKLGYSGEEILAKMEKFLSGRKDTIRKQCALAFKIAWLTGIRVGCEESALGTLSKKGVKAFGLTTLQKQMVKAKLKNVVFEFTGKKGVQQCITISDPQLCKQIKERVQHANDNSVFDISDYHMRLFVKRYIGQKFMIKDVRTLRANLIATKESQELLNVKKQMKKAEAKRELKLISEKVAAILGNTPAMSRRAYVDPYILQHHLEQRLAS